MSKVKPIHTDFLFHLEFKNKGLIDLFKDLRELVLEIAPKSNEVLYLTHALTTVFSVSDKLGDAFCMINIYTNHLNLGFNKGTLIKDPHKLLQGTGNLIRHIPIENSTDYRNKKVKDLIKAAFNFALKDQDTSTPITGKTISKIKSTKS